MVTRKLSLSFQGLSLSREIGATLVVGLEFIGGCHPHPGRRAPPHFPSSPFFPQADTERNERHVFIASILSFNLGLFPGSLSLVLRLSVPRHSFIAPRLRSLHPSFEIHGTEDVFAD